MTSAIRTTATPAVTPSSAVTLKPGSHIDAVMALFSNKTHRQVLTSSSTNGIVKL